VYAFDEVTGERRWSFDNIPSGRMPGADSWKIGGDHGGGSIWSTFSVDPGAALVYAPIGNPAPDFIGEARPGANLFTESVVAIESKTGKLAWYAQQVPHDIHDWDTAAAPTLFEQDGKSYMAVGNKEGYVYLYDRTHHKLVAKTEVTEHENVDDAITTAGVHVCPGWLGGVEWNGTAYSPADRMVYVNSVHWCGVYKKWASTPHYVPGEPYEGGDFIIDPQGTAYGWTRGIEIPSGKERWAVRATTPMVAAVTATAGGLVLTGELSGDFKALDSKTGRELYRFNTGGAIAGGISVFAVNGKEYIAVVSGNASKSTIWGTTGAPTIFVFSLPEAK
jgi:glucose dehydrogenase